MSSSFNGRIALITGANQGIGLQIAILLTREGANLILFNRSVGKLDALTAAAPDAKVREERVDIGDVDAVTTAVEGLGVERVDVLINNAGIALGHVYYPKVGTQGLVFGYS